MGDCGGEVMSKGIMKILGILVLVLFLGTVVAGMVQGGMVYE